MRLIIWVNEEWEVRIAVFIFHIETPGPAGGAPEGLAFALHSQEPEGA